MPDEQHDIGATRTFVKHNRCYLGITCFRQLPVLRALPGMIPMTFFFLWHCELDDDDPLVFPRQHKDVWTLHCLDHTRKFIRICAWCLPSSVIWRRLTPRCSFMNAIWSIYESHETILSLPLWHSEASIFFTQILWPSYQDWPLPNHAMFPWSFCNGCDMPAGALAPPDIWSHHILGLAYALIVETSRFPWAAVIVWTFLQISLGTFSIVAT